MEAPWVSRFKEALIGRDAGPLLMTLATIDAAFGVDARTIVVRDVDLNGAVWFTSDARSRKNAQLAADPRAAAVIWLPHRREQYRFRGVIEKIESADERRRIWNNLANATKASFFWPTPGDKRTSRAFEEPPANPEPPASFSVLKLLPTSVDILELNMSPHQRWLWMRSTGWVCEEINP